MIGLSLREELEHRGISRREFVAFCASMAAVLGLPGAAAAIAAAIETEPRPILVWLEFQDCAGNTESLLRASHPTVADLILDSISLSYHETLMAAAGSQAEEALAQTVRDNKGKYIALVEGSIPTGADGAYCTIGGKSALHIAREICGGAAATIAVGTCAAFGGIPAARPNPTGALSVADAVPGVKNLINMSACPANAENITALIVYYLTLKRWPPLDQYRPSAVRLRQDDPRQLRAARAFRCRPIRRSLGRRSASSGPLPLQDGMQRAGDVAELSGRALERRHQLADRLRSSLHRLRRAEFLGHDDAVLRAASQCRRLRCRRVDRPGRAWSHRPRRGGGGAARRRRGRAPSDRKPFCRRRRIGDRVMAHIVVDPVTRIEGHLRVEAEVDGGAVKEAWSSSTMFRGIELILRGRDPRDAWAFAQRICGVCTTVHAIASIRAVENAIGAVPPPNARLLRNLIMAAQIVHDHVVHFYHLHALDWVDIVSALERRSGQDLDAGAIDLGLAAVQHQLFFRCARSHEGLCRARPARHFRQRLLGPSRLSAAAGGQSDGGGALSRGARFSAPLHQDPRHPRRQEPAPAKLPGRRHGDPGRSRFPIRAQHGHDRGAERAGGRRLVLRQPRLPAGCAGDRVLLQGLGLDRRRHRQLHGLWRLSGGRRRQSTSCSCRRA